MNLIFQIIFINFVIFFFDNFNEKDRSFVERTLNKNLSCIQFENVKKKNVPKIKSVLIHKKFNKILSLSFYYKIITPNTLDLYIVMPYEGSIEIKLSIKEVLESLNEWAISIVDSFSNEVKPVSIKKIDKTQELEVIFGRRKVQFGEVYLCKFDFNNKKINIDNNCYLKFYQYDKYANAIIDLSQLSL